MSASGEPARLRPADVASAGGTSPHIAHVELPRALTLRDVVLLNLVSVLSLRWLATASANGPSVVMLWVLAALFFFVPLGLAVSELSTRYPHQGGIYAWTKQTFGEGHGFLCGWCYWVNNLLYYPNLLIASSVMATYAFGLGGTGLEENWTYVLPATLGMLWFATLLNIVGLGTGKWLQNVGAVSALTPGVILLGFGAYAAFTREPANVISTETLVPRLTEWSQLNLWASIAFAFTGIELSATMSDEVRDPKRTLARSVLIAAPIIAGIYIIGTLAMLWLIPSQEINIVSGLLQALQAGAGGALTWLVPVSALLYVAGNLGGVGAWLVGPSRVAFVIGLDRYFPPAFGRVHPKWKTPHVAILVQSTCASVLLLLSVIGEGTTVAKAYLILLDTMILIYFIPFIYLFLTYLHEARHRPSGWTRGARAWAIGISGLLLTLLAMFVAMVPPPDTPNKLVFELKVVGGALMFILVGGVFYWRGRRKLAAAS